MARPSKYPTDLRERAVRVVGPAVGEIFEAFRQGEQLQARGLVAHRPECAVPGIRGELRGKCGVVPCRKGLERDAGGGQTA